MTEKQRDREVRKKGGGGLLGDNSYSNERSGTSDIG